MGLSGDWRDSRWGHAIYAGLVVISAGAAVAFDDQFSSPVRALGAVVGFLALLMLAYSVLRLTGLLPRRGPGRRRLGKDTGPVDTEQ